MTPWDVTKAAETHAALAGVLAGLALAIIALRRGASALDRRSPSSVDKASSPNSTYVALSAVLLALSAMAWGELSGYPEAQEIAAGLKETGTLRDQAAATAAAEMLVGTAATLLTAVGALLVLYELLQVVDKSVDGKVADRSRATRGAFGFICAVASLQVVQFSLTSLERVADRHVINLNAAGIIVGATVFAITWSHGRWRFPTYPTSWRKPSGLNDLPFWLGMSSASTALFAYALVPVHTFGRSAPVIGQSHFLALVSLVLSGVLFLAFVVAAGYSLMNRGRVIERTDEEGLQERRSH